MIKFEDFIRDKEMIRIMLEAQIGDTSDNEFTQAFDMTLEDLKGNRFTKKDIEYFFNTLSTCIDIVRRLN